MTGEWLNPERERQRKIKKRTDAGTATRPLPGRNGRAHGDGGWRALPGKGTDLMKLRAGGRGKSALQAQRCFAEPQIPSERD